MKTAELKQYNAKVNGKSMIVVKISEIDESAKNLLKAVNFEEVKGMLMREKKFDKNEIIETAKEQEDYLMMSNNTLKSFTESVLKAETTEKLYSLTNNLM